MTRPEVTMDPDHTYYVGDLVLPSVTTIIGATVPKDLSWWGMQVAADGIAALLRSGHVGRGATGPELIEHLKRHKLTVRDRMGDAASIGTLLHRAFEDYGRDGKVPQAREFPEEARPRVEGLCGWLLANQPEFLANEVKTVSLKHGYAGTLDARVRFQAGPHEGKVALLDMKNTRRVYPDSMFPQLEAYEEAEREWGVEPTDFRAVLHLAHDGKVTLRKSTFGFEDFAVLLAAYQRKRARSKR